MYAGKTVGAFVCVFWYLCVFEGAILGCVGSAGVCRVC